MEKNTVSVVIPVYNEAKRIKETLDAIYNNSILPHEIIVADGGSKDNTVEIIKTNYPDVKVLKNEKKTAAAGRNIGIKAATGNIIAFTDGDCVVDRDWIKNIYEFFEKNDIDGVGGKILNAKPENHYEEYWGNLAWNLIMSFPDEEFLITEKTINGSIVTANCAYKKKFLLEMGGFREWFGNNAEDTDLCWKAIDEGAKLKYFPNIIIYAHNVTSLKGIAKKSFRNGFSSSKLQKIYGSKINFDPNIYKMLFKNLIGILKNEKDAGINVIELICHLFGKYCGSIRLGVINI